MATAVEGKTEAEMMSEILSNPDFVVPDRGDLDCPDIKWRTQKPQYTKTNYAFMKQKLCNHAKDSLEMIVENFVKTWEMEVSHKTDIHQWSTMNLDQFEMSANQGCPVSANTLYEKGNYNLLLGGCPAFQSMAEMSFEESHEYFMSRSQGIFPWEVLAVLKGFPEVVFSWRHWGDFLIDGQMKQVQMFGLTVALFNQGAPPKLNRLDIYLDAQSFLEVLHGKADPDHSSSTKVLFQDLESAKKAAQNMRRMGTWTAA